MNILKPEAVVWKPEEVDVGTHDAASAAGTVFVVMLIITALIATLTYVIGHDSGERKGYHEGRSVECSHAR